MSSRSAARAVRHGAALIDRADLTLLKVGGADRRDFLHRVLSADVGSLDEGQACPGALLTPKGRVVAAMTAVVRSEAIWLIVDRCWADGLRQQLERYVVIDEVVLEPDARQIWGAYGPELAALAGVGRQLAAVEPYRTAEIALGGRRALAVGDDSLAVAGALLIEAGSGIDLGDALIGAGATLIDFERYDIARVEAGTPRMGHELDEDVLILEAGQRGRVSFAKGCYIGQEPVCRINSRGQVKRLLVGLRSAGERIPARGEVLRAAARDDAGRVTSAVRSDELDAVIALAYVHRSCAEPGTRLGLENGGEATVVDLPQIPTRRRPRVCPSYEDNERS